MKNKFLFGLAIVTALTGCGPTKPAKMSSASQVKDLPTADGETLNLSVMHNQQYRMKYVEDNKTKSPYVLPYNSPDGNTYGVGDFKPVWKEIQNRLNFTIKDVTPSESSAANNYSNVWKKNQFKDAAGEAVDVLNGNGVEFTKEGTVNNQFVALNQYWDYLPNFKKFLEENPVVANSIVAGNGNIYYAPYFDGYNSVERMSIMRADWVEKLLNGASFTANAADTESFGKFSYTKNLPASLDTKINVVKEDGSGKTTVTKKYAKNIIDLMDEIPEAQRTPQKLADTLRNYIDSTYGSFYGNNRANLFVGQSAAYDADELVALMRVIKANNATLTGSDSIGVIPFFPRANTTDRTSDLLRWAGVTFGVRGLESRKDYLYVDKNGVLQDSRISDNTYDMIEKVNQIYKEGLIVTDFGKGTAASTYRENLVRDTGKANQGFMTYDYNQTTTAHNGSALAAAQPGYNLTPVLPAVANWDNGGEYFHFTESIRSVKTDAWAINANISKTKIRKALELFDYQYSEKGNKLMSFGPDAWLDGTLEYKGQQIPKFKQQVYDMFNAKPAVAPAGGVAGGAEGNYTNFLRGWLGGTFPIGYVKNQGVEYQLTAVNGQKGEAKIEKAIGLGTMKALNPTLYPSQAKDKTLLVIPTTLPFTANEETVLADTAITTLNNKFKQVSAAADISNNVFINYVMSGWGTNTTTTDGSGLTKEAFKNWIKVELKANSAYIETQRAGYNRAIKNIV